jgi:hypothetical protein
MASQRLLRPPFWKEQRKCRHAIYRALFDFTRRASFEKRYTCAETSHISQQGAQTSAPVRCARPGHSSGAPPATRLRDEKDDTGDCAIRCLDIMVATKDDLVSQGYRTKKASCAARYFGDTRSHSLQRSCIALELPTAGILTSREWQRRDGPQLFVTPSPPEYKPARKRDCAPPP